tara:strand:+ start:844 stop:1806 length:963 start_codon:yes stop_codon:yes gene_type:complete
LEFDNYKKKTFTSYWNNFSEKPKSLINSKNYLKSLKLKIIKLLGFKVSIRINKNRPHEDVAYTSYPIEQKIKKQKNNLIIKEIISFLKSSNIRYHKQKIVEYISEFDYVFSQSPVKEHESGFGYNEGVFFFTILKIIKPELVIESGVMKGFTTYLIDAATENDCKIFCYDINFDNKIFNSQKATYINCDISKNIPSIQNKKVVALWDDHTSQLDRLKFSQEHKIEYNFFDDDLSFLNIHSDGWPPIPTISMLKDIKNNYIQSDQISWVSRNRQGTAYLTNFKEIDCVDKIKFHKIFPQLFEITGYKNHSQCSLVINDITR